MKIFSQSNKIVLYLNESLESFGEIEAALRSTGNPTLLRIADEMHRVNISGACGIYLHPDMSDDVLVPDYELQWWRSLLAQAIRLDIKEKMAVDPEMGSLKRREYAARSEAYSLAGSPKDVDWTKPGSIEISDSIKRRYLLKNFKFEIGDIVKVDMSPKLKNFANHPMFAKDQGLVKIIGRRETDHEPEYDLEPYPLPDDHPDDYQRSLYQKFLK